MATLGHEQGQVDAGLGQVGEAAVAKLMEGPAPARGDGEQVSGATVGEAGPATVFVDIGPGGLARRRGTPVGQEKRSLAAPLEVAGQQPGG